MPVCFGAALAKIRLYYDFVYERVMAGHPLPQNGTGANIARAAMRTEGAMGDLDPIVFPGAARHEASRSETRVSGIKGSPATRVSIGAKVTTFDRRELLRILDLYGRKVAAGEWRDYAISFLKDRAVFAVFRRSSELPLYRIEKNATLARRQGAYAVVAAGGRVLKRGHDLDRVLRVLDPALRVV